MDVAVHDASVDHQVISTIKPQQPEVARENKKRAGFLGSRNNQSDSVNVQLDDVYKSLTVLGDKVIKKLNEILGDQVPGGIKSLNPEDHTPEKTADRIVSGVSGLLPAFAAQNPDLEGEELITAFMDEVKKGIQQGYEDARGMLEAIGALQFDGVDSGIEETMRLVEEKLDALAKQLIGSDDTEQAEPKMEEAPAAEVQQQTDAVA